MFREIWTELCLNKLSNWQWLCIKVLHVDTHRKHTKVIGKILVAGKHLTIGVRGPGEKPSWGETRLSDTRVATLDRSPDQSPGVRPLSPSH